MRAVEFAMGMVTGAALQADGYTGRAKAVVHEDRCVLLGVTIVGPGAVDHLHAATIAVNAEVLSTYFGTLFLLTRPRAKSGSDC